MKTDIKFSVTILGNSAAIPTENHHPASQLVIYENNYFLVDCGEGTQMQLIKYKIKYNRIDNIFISHMHGDHFFGLIGLISTYNLLGREKELHIYGPDNLKGIINNLLVGSYTRLKFKIVFHNLIKKSKSIIYENNKISISSFPLVHRIPTWGFRFQEKTIPRNIKKSFIKEFNPTIEDIKKIKKGSAYHTSDKGVLDNDSITHPPTPLLSYAYCSDTMYDESIIKHVKDVSLIYHEATFNNSMQYLANEKYHSTAKDAATLAKKANAKKLILGHFSARYKELKSLQEEASKVFALTILSEEGRKYSINTNE